jgi:hypothetical protein
MVEPCLIKAKHLQKLFVVLSLTLDHHWRRTGQPLPPNRRFRCPAHEQIKAADYFWRYRSAFEPVLSPAPLHVPVLQA